ncbi:MAG TPA: LON peptidase substrate-binding domain-containing protein [Gammaproteobacteria bacterium]
MAHEVPLFPLHTVLFPGGPLALRVFEARYLDMIGRCLKAGVGFGVVAIARGSEVGAAETYSVGTMAEIVDWHREPDGLLGIHARGGARFRLSATRRLPDGLYVGDAELLPPEPRAGLPPEHARLAALLERALAPLADRYKLVERAYDDATWVGYRLAEVLPLSVATKQRLLEMEDARARLAELDARLIVA